MESGLPVHIRTVMPVKLDNLRITVSNVAQNKIQSGLEKACMIVESAAKENCPKDNGILVNSITHQVDGNVGYVYSDLPYAIYTELGTGIFAETNEGALSGTGRQTPWRYFYTGKKLSSAEQAYVKEHGYQTFQGKQGVWRTTKGQHGTHFLYKALSDNETEIKDCF